MLKDRQAFVYLHPKGLLVGPYSGPGACVQEDWAQRATWLDGIDTVDPGLLGATVRAAWARCREIPLIPYKDVIGKHCEVVGATNLKTLNAGTRLVSPFLKEGTVTVGATKQKTPAIFEPVPASKVRLSDEVSDAELGAAVMAALLASE